MSSFMLLGNCADCGEQSPLFLSSKKYELRCFIGSCAWHDRPHSLTHAHSLTGKEHLLYVITRRKSLRVEGIMSFYIVPSKEINNRATKEYFIYTWCLPGSYNWYGFLCDSYIVLMRILTECLLRIRILVWHIVLMQILAWLVRQVFSDRNISARLPIDNWIGCACSCCMYWNNDTPAILYIHTCSEHLASRWK